ncbi:MAG: hypothetical protein M3Y08_12575 [Fibrobacterota bacterium]|nr:hypothetical protein [Fibrobacterota bacterium]
MRPDLERPAPEKLPMVGGVEKLEGTPGGAYKDRDEDIISLLREKLKERTGRNAKDTKAGMKFLNGPEGDEDKYEPQRLSRKICWQYDINAKKVPLLRRHYI